MSWGALCQEKQSPEQWAAGRSCYSSPAPRETGLPPARRRKEGRNRDLAASAPQNLPFWAGGVNDRDPILHLMAAQFMWATPAKCGAELSERSDCRERAHYYQNNKLKEEKCKWTYTWDCKLLHSWCGQLWGLELHQWAHKKGRKRKTPSPQHRCVFSLGVFVSLVWENEYFCLVRVKIVENCLGQVSHSLTLYICAGSLDKPTKLLFIPLLKRKQGCKSFQAGREGMGKMQSTYQWAQRWSLLRARLSPTYSLSLSEGYKTQAVKLKTNLWRCYRQWQQCPVLSLRGAELVSPRSQPRPRVFFKDHYFRGVRAGAGGVWTFTGGSDLQQPCYSCPSWLQGQLPLLVTRSAQAGMAQDTCGV